MSEKAKLSIPAPPEGFVWAQDYETADGRIILGIASRLGITYHTYRKWRMRGETPPTVRIGKRLAARIEWVDQFAAKREQEAIDAFNAAVQDVEYSMRPAESRLAA
ncbi:hypothetical protein EAO70_20750 [Streptomyces sp. adm13(2018)]|uniref:hypothetical protein n=1 Tax=Streptomyces sp. adm13(2018) TaxID=2479007 RepID=UPI0011CD5835|nr:hypothetical protein [Streptomyces sp. adm13(2018)]TXS14015.1 hypothetical protein EAO70_20750 [Streptomyces sp. adm13(2018)]